MSIAHLASWLVAVSLVPMLSAKLPPPKFIGRETAITRLRERYGRLVTWTLAHRRWTMAGVFALLVLSIIPIALTKKDMFDSGESRRLYLRYELNANYRLQDLKPAVTQVEKFLEKNRERFEIKSMYTYYTEQGDATTSILLTEADKAKRGSNDIKEEMRKELPVLAVGKVSFDFRGGTGGGVDVALIGDSMDQLRELAPTVVNVMSRLPTLQATCAPKRATATAKSRRTSIAIRAKNYGFDAQTVANYVQIALRGMPLKDFHAGDRQLPVWLRFQGADTQSLAGLSDFKLRAPDGTQIPLMSLMRADARDTPTAIQRVDRMTALKITANLAEGKTMPEAREEITKAHGRLRAARRAIAGISARDSIATKTPARRCCSTR